MIVAGIDLGTNSALLLVAQAEGGRITPLLEEEREIRIGEGLSRGGTLRKDAMERAIRALSEFRGRAQRLGAEKVILAGTSALREAKNRGEFLGLLQERLNGELSVLRPREEAELSFHGALYGLEGLDSPVLMADIGGGSTELVQGDEGKIAKWRSLSLGGVRLTEGYIYSDPISQGNLENLNGEILKRFQGSSSDFSSKGVLVGVGGTITTLAAMDMGMAHYDAQLVHGYKLSLSAVSSIFAKLKRSTLAQRRRMIGLSPKRAEIILAGAAICLKLMEFLSRAEILVSSRGLRWGLVLQELVKG